MSLCFNNVLPFVLALARIVRTSSPSQTAESKRRLRENPSVGLELLHAFSDILQPF